MRTKISESQFPSGLHISFINLKYVDDFDKLANIINNNFSVELIENVDGIWSRYRTYKIEKFEFQLMYHEEIGNCLRLRLKRDRGQDKENYERLRKIGNEIMNLLNATKI